MLPWCLFQYSGTRRAHILFCDILAKAEEKGEPPFLILLDNVEDPHNLGAIIRTANLAGAHGVIIPKRRAVGLTSTVAKTSAGAINYTPVAKVTILEPVVVNPETVSKSASTGCGIYPLTTKGTAPKTHKATQLRATATQPSLV